MAYTNAYAGSGTTTVGSGSLGLGYPASVTTDDIFIAAAYSQGGLLTLSDGGGSTWTQIANDGVYGLWWARHDGSIGASVSWTGESNSGDPDYIDFQMGGRIFAFRGGIASPTSPIDTYNGPTSSGAATTHYGATPTLNYDNDLILMIEITTANKTLTAAGGSIDTYFSGGNTVSPAFSTLAGYKLDYGTKGTITAPSLTWGGGNAGAYVWTVSLRTAAAAPSGNTALRCLLGVG